MTSIKKGDDLEAKIFDLFASEISNDRFYLRKECCKIFRKKGYYSKDRAKNIIFDVSIESFLPDQESPSLLVLIECKNYNHPVPVDDVEEFYSKVQQISGANVKGIIASTNSFQEGTLNFSSSKGVGLLRYYGNQNFKWVLTRSPSSLLLLNHADTWIDAYRGITNQGFHSEYFDCYCYLNGNYTNSLKQFISQLLKFGDADNVVEHLENSQNQVINFVSYLAEDVIEDLSTNVLATIGYLRGEVPVEDVCKWLTLENGLTVESTYSSGGVNTGILGKITFKPLKISLYKQNHVNISQWKFTLAHELGHLLLGHGQYMDSEYCRDSDFEFESQPDITVKDIVRLEWQANFFASCLLLPKIQFATDFLRFRQELGIKDRGHGLLYLDKQGCNVYDFFKVTDRLIDKYNVSRSVTKIRLKRLGLLVEAKAVGEPTRLGFIDRS